MAEPVDTSAPLPAIDMDEDATEFRGEFGDDDNVLMRANVWPIGADARTYGPMSLGNVVRLLAALPEAKRREVIGQALGITGLGGFECDPRDSASLEELRNVIDEELEWHTPEEEDAADYVANIRQTRRDLDEMDAARREEKARADRAEKLLALYRRGYEARGKLNVAYRTGGHPSEKTLDTLNAVTEKLKELEPK